MRSDRVCRSVEAMAGPGLKTALALTLALIHRWQMNRPYILLSMMVVMVGALFATHEALAKVLTGTGGDEMLLGTDRDDRLYGRSGDDEIEGGSGNDEIFPGKGDDEVDAGAGNDLIYARDTDGVDHIDCGGGFAKVETIHRDDRTESNCERALGPRQGDI